MYSIEIHQVMNAFGCFVKQKQELAVF